MPNLINSSPSIHTILEHANNDVASHLSIESHQHVTAVSDLRRKCEAVSYTRAVSLLNSADEQESLNLRTLKAAWQQYRKTVFNTEFDLETSANTLFLQCFIALKANVLAKDFIRFFFGECNVLQAEIKTYRLGTTRTQDIIFTQKSLDDAITFKG